MFYLVFKLSFFSFSFSFSFYLFIRLPSLSQSLKLIICDNDNDEVHFDNEGVGDDDFDDVLKQTHILTPQI